MLIETTETAASRRVSRVVLPALVEARAEGLSRGPSRRSPCGASSMWPMGTHMVKNLPFHACRASPGAPQSTDPAPPV